jgi:hypothetical protein
MAFRRHHRDDGTFQGQIISGAPFRGPTFEAVAIGEAGRAAVDDADVGNGNHEHRNDERIVTLTGVPTRFGADVVVAALKSRGIKAGAAGSRVVVFERDLATARAIIAETDGQDADDDQAANDDEPGFGQQ